MTHEGDKTGNLLVRVSCIELEHFRTKPFSFQQVSPCQSKRHLDFVFYKWLGSMPMGGLAAVNTDNYMPGCRRHLEHTKQPQPY